LLLFRERKRKQWAAGGELRVRRESSLNEGASVVLEKPGSLK
jgi:hypothetical protein